MTDYRAVDPSYGSWDDVEKLGRRYRLMFDAVINHVSAESQWFQAFLRGEPDYSDYFIRISGSPDLSTVVRPRSQPLLTHFETLQGSDAVWTTFGPDQIDLNYRNPNVLIEILDMLLYYVEQGGVISPPRRRRLPLEGIGYRMHPPPADALDRAAVSRRYGRLWPRTWRC